MKKIFASLLLSALLLGGAASLAGAEASATAASESVRLAQLNTAEANHTPARTQSLPEKENLENGLDSDDADAIGGLAPFLVFLVMPLGLIGVLTYAIFFRKKSILGSR